MHIMDLSNLGIEGVGCISTLSTVTRTRARSPFYIGRIEPYIISTHQQPKIRTNIDDRT